MNTTAASDVGRQTMRSVSSPVIPALATEATVLESETIADSNQQLFSNLLEALFQDRDEEENEEPDDVAPVESARTAVRGCERLTNEIIRLEKLRQTVAQLHVHRDEVHGTSKDILQILLDAYDRKIRDCEDQLDRSLERYRKNRTSCGVLVDYYLG